MIPAMTNSRLEFLPVSTYTWRMSKYKLQPNSIQPKHEQIFHKIILAEMLLTEDIFLNAHLHNNNMKHIPVKRNQLLKEQVTGSLLWAWSQDFLFHDLPVTGSVLSFPENAMGLETGTGILRALSFGAAGTASVFRRGGTISAFGDGGKIAPVCLAK